MQLTTCNRPFSTAQHAMRFGKLKTKSDFVDPKKPLNTLFPEIKPYKTHKLPVSKIHTLYIEEVGNPKGEPVVFLHGGPGGGLSPMARQLFDPKFYRIILFDQRGSGKSTPFASLKNNTTEDLVQDIEKIREHLGIEKWAVLGGSWGSTLALAYSEAHPDKVNGLILRGIFMGRPKELNWMYQEGGASMVFPDAFEDYVKPIPPAERGNMIKAYYKRLTSKSAAVRKKAAQAWNAWEMTILKLFPDLKGIKSSHNPKESLPISRIEAHYFKNGSIFKDPDQLLKNVDKIRHIPTWIIQGRYDMVCPMVSAWDLKTAFPQAKLHIVADGGHGTSEPGIASGYIDATEALKKRIQSTK